MKSKQLSTWSETVSRHLATHDRGRQTAALPSLLEKQCTCKEVKAAPDVHTYRGCLGLVPEEPEMGFTSLTPQWSPSLPPTTPSKIPGTSKGSLQANPYLEADGSPFDGNAGLATEDPSRPGLCHWPSSPKQAPPVIPTPSSGGSPAPSALVWHHTHM